MNSCSVNPVPPWAWVTYLKESTVSHSEQFQNFAMCVKSISFIVFWLTYFGGSQFLYWMLCKQIIHSSPIAQHSWFWRVLSYPFLLIFLAYFIASYNAAVLYLWLYLSFLFISFQIFCSLCGSEEIRVTVGICVLFRVLSRFLTSSLPLDACQNQLWHCH